MDARRTPIPPARVPHDAPGMSPTATQHDARPAAALPAALRLGPVELTVSDVDRSVAWYQQALGLRVHRHEPSVAALGDGHEATVVLVEDPQARPAGRGTTGLYHYALLYPTRQELARAVARLAATRTPVDGASDHGTHEAIYLPDPDGNGIELAWDRARELWPSSDRMAAAQRALDFPSLMATIAGESPAPHVGAGLRMGHLHLHVGDVAEAVRFYREVLGFDVKADLGTAAFLAAGGYHHHLGVNVWNGRGATAPPPHTAGLRRWTVELPGGDDLAAVRERLLTAGAPVDDVERGLVTADPFGTRVAFVVAEGPEAGR